MSPVDAIEGRVVRRVFSFVSSLGQAGKGDQDEDWYRGRQTLMPPPHGKGFILGLKNQNERYETS